VKLSTESLAAASARHPRRTLGAWTVVAVLAIVAIVLLLGGSLTTEGKPTNKPESERADDVRLAAFPSDPSNTGSISSSRIPRWRTNGDSGMNARMISLRVVAMAGSLDELRSRAGGSGGRRGCISWHSLCSAARRSTKRTAYMHFS
jgi:hypothetical protein